MALIKAGECKVLEVSDDKDVWNCFTADPHYGLSRSWALPHWFTKDSELKAKCKNVKLRVTHPGFTVFVDVRLFEAKEICVKAVDHTLIVECHHGSRPCDGSTEENFLRKFYVPFEYDMELVHSTLSKDRILELEVPLLKTHTEGEERIIKVHQTDKPSMIMGLLADRAHSLWKYLHFTPSE